MQVVLALAALVAVGFSLRWASRATSRRRMFEQVAWFTAAGAEVEAEEE